MRSFLYLALLVPGLVFAQESNPQEATSDATSACPILDSLKAIKKAPKGLPERAMSEAAENAGCTKAYFQHVTEKNPNWKKLRKLLPEKQPDILLEIYGVKKLSSDEQKKIFFSNAVSQTQTCQTLSDSVGLDALSGKDWIKRTTAWDTTGFLCKTVLKEKVLPLLDSILTDSTTHRAKLLAYYPEAWYEKHIDESSELEKVLYATSPSLYDSTHCRYADYASADQLAKIGLPSNACASYIKERFGAPLLRMQFRKTYKPAVLAQLNKRLNTITPENLEANKGLLDTIEILFGDGESWDVLDSLEVSILNLLAKNPMAVKQFGDPTATMLLTAFDAHLPLLCDYPDITDKMLIKLINDRANSEKPLPTPEELAILKECLAPNLASSLVRMMQQLAP